jgi:hypothetical protein
VLVLVLARLVLVGRLVWLLLVLVNLRRHYFSCSPGFGPSNVDGPLDGAATVIGFTVNQGRKI